MNNKTESSEMKEVSWDTFIVKSAINSISYVDVRLLVATSLDRWIGVLLVIKKGTKSNGIV